jgi:hypothetical protein
LIALVVLLVLVIESAGDENGNGKEFFPRHSSLNLYAPLMEKPGQLRELFRLSNEEKTASRCALERRVG